MEQLICLQCGWAGEEDQLVCKNGDWRGVYYIYCLSCGGTSFDAEEIEEEDLET